MDKFNNCPSSTIWNEYLQKRTIYIQYFTDYENNFWFSLSTLKHLPTLLKKKSQRNQTNSFFSVNQCKKETKFLAEQFFQNVKVYISSCPCENREDHRFFLLYEKPNGKAFPILVRKKYLVSWLWLKGLKQVHLQMEYWAKSSTARKSW